jgi:hypothetical protein
MSQSLKKVLDAANPNTLADGMRILGFGQILRSAISTQIRMGTPLAATNVLATLRSFALPSDAKASSIQRAYARAGGGTLGELAVQAFGATPADGQIAVAPNGDIVLLAASTYSQVDVEFIPEKGDEFIFAGSVAANVLTLPASLTGRGVILLADANATAGTTLGKKIILVPGAGAPAAGQARLNLAKGTVTFAVADAVTAATVTLTVVSAINVPALLDADSTIM